MDSSTKKEFKVGDWHVLAEENCLVKDNQRTFVIPKVMDLLLYFCANPNQVISLQTLSETVWPKEFVGDNAIYNLVGQLRKALQDNAADPCYIQTLSKKGYRLIAQVSSEIEASVVVEQKQIVYVDTPVHRAPSIHYTIAGLTALAAVFAMLVWLSFDTVEHESNPTMVAQHRALGEFHLNKGQPANVKKSIDYFQQALVLAPTDIPILTDLGFAYYQLSNMNDFAVQTYDQKALKIAQKILELDTNNLNASVLLFLNQSSSGELSSISSWKELETPDLLHHRALHAISRVFFNMGQMKDAITLQSIALQKCANCPYIYFSLANSQLVKGEIDQAFKNYQIYLELNDSRVTNPVNHLGYSSLTKDKLAATAKWMATNKVTGEVKPAQRNALALFYLSLRRVEQAEQAMQVAYENNEDNFFTLYTLAALSSALRDPLKTHQYLENRFRRYPKNPKFALSVAYSYWISGEDKKALDVLNQHLIKDNTLQPSQSMEIGLIQLYGELLVRNNQIEKGTNILNALLERFEQGLLRSSSEGTIGYAQTLASLGKQKRALSELTLALESGWVEDFNNNWWYLENDPFFKELAKLDEFKLLTQRHKNAIETLTTQIE